MPFTDAFLPPWFLRNRHVQTLLGHFLPGPPFRQPTVRRLVPVSGGDRIVLHDSMPPAWNPGDPVAVLVHGLAGCHQSGHMVRFAHLFHGRGVRVVRVDLRGTGAGLALARQSYHAGRSEDGRAVLAAVHALSPASPLWLVGVSLGGNMVLKLAGEAATEPVPGLAKVAALGPPVDMARCAVLLARRSNRLYNRYFARCLVREVLFRQRAFPDLPRVSFPRKTTLRVFDNLYTAPRNGFAGADDYYRRASALPLVGSIPVPTLVVTARDDPFIAAEPFEELRPPAHVEVRLLDHGGHLGFVGRDGAGGWRWVERRVADWLLRSD
jgi:predicted alpha/beta-fold hydrolase